MNSDINLKGNEKDTPSPESSVALFVSLYMVLLSFFILLAAHANFDTEKSRYVMDSVNKAFSPNIRTETDMRLRALGDELSVTQFFDDMQQSLQSIVPVEEMDVITDGKSMLIVMPVTALFNRDDPNLRYDRRNFYQRLSDTMRKWRDGAEIQLSMLQGVSKPVRAGATATSTLEITRAGNFARFMENQGVDPHQLAVAIEQGNPDTITLIFDVLAADRSKIDLGEAVTSPAPPSPVPLQSVGGGQ